MSGKLYKLVIAGVFLLALCATANAQRAAASKRADAKETSAGGQLLNLSGKVAVIIVGQTARAAWTTTKFAASDVAKPIAKGIFLKAAPKITVFALKLTGQAMKKGVPVVEKLAITYLKTRLPI